MVSNVIVGSVIHWGAKDVYGIVQALDRRNITVQLDTGERKTFTVAAGIERLEFRPGDQIQLFGGDGSVGLVLKAVDSPTQPMWSVSFPGGPKTVPEMAIRPAILEDPVARLAAGQLGKASEFNLKSVAADLWLEHLHNPLISLAHARVDLKPYQVAVTHRVISNYPHRFILADEVGLGKTIEAAMIIKELRARKQASRVLILVPSGLLRQWQFELKTKFNETFAIYNRQTVEYLKNTGIKYPWLDSDSIIASHTWTSWTPKRRAEISNLDWDLIIVDEAHHARRQRTGTRVTRTNLYRLVHDLTSRPGSERRSVLFLTATPMQLQRHELYSLVEMIDPVLFATERDFEGHLDDLSYLNQLVEQLQRDGFPEKTAEVEDLEAMISDLLGVDEAIAHRYIENGDVEELISDLRSAHRLSEVLIRNRRSVVGGFQPRTAFRWEVERTDIEKAVQVEMDEILRLGFELSATTGRNAVGFLMTTFQKLSASSSRALLKSLKKRRGRLVAGETRSAVALSVRNAEDRLADDAEASIVVAELSIDPIESPEEGASYEVQAISEVIDLLEQVGIDSKTKVLAKNLFTLFETDTNGKVLIFTEFRETQDMLHEVLTGSGWGVNVFHGQLSPLQKDEAVERFREGSGPQILVSTEAGGEGRNFQFCHVLINYDLPWNPMKVEQRIGRVDRIGQEHPVMVFNFHVKGTIEGRILDVLEKRINLFESSVGGLEPILGETESDIRKALKLTADARDLAFSELEQRTEQSVKEAREAEEKLADLILDSKSYSAKIAQTASGVEAPISQARFEDFLRRLLTSANTYIKRSKEDEEVWKIMFHPPFSVQRPDLIGPDPKRRVCFNPQARVDSEMVEYMGFGHPIIDELLRRTVSENLAASAAIRRVGPDITDEDGWQFNFLVKIVGVKSVSSVFPVFVSDDGEVNLDVGTRLLNRSYEFASEEFAANIDADLARSTYEDAQTAAILHATTLQQEAAAKADAETTIEEERINKVFEHRLEAAGDKIEQSTTILAQMEQGDDEAKKTVAMWQANVTRAEGELESVRDDRENALADLVKKRNPTFEFDLLNAARIFVERSVDA